MEEGNPSDLVQSTVWSPAQAITCCCLDFRPPDRIQYITSPSLPASSTASLLRLAQPARSSGGAPPHSP